MSAGVEKTVAQWRKRDEVNGQSVIKDNDNDGN